MRASKIFINSVALLAISFQSAFGIYNGKTAIPHSHPWLLSLKRTSNGFDWGHFCGAALIRVPYLKDATDIAITAAHCIKDGFALYPRFVHAVASNHDLERYDWGETEVEVIAFIIRPDYSTSFEYTSDIAILKLANPLYFSTTIRPIELPTKDEPVPHGAECFLAGWGAITYKFDHDGTITPTGHARFLQEISIKRLNDSICRLMSFDEQAKLCNIAPLGHHSGTGDSGSPLVCKRGGKDVFYGIVSGGWQAPSDGIAMTVYTKVSAFTDWIRTHVERNEISDWESVQRLGNMLAGVLFMFMILVLLIYICANCLSAN